MSRGVFALGADTGKEHRQAQVRRISGTEEIGIGSSRIRDGGVSENENRDEDRATHHLGYIRPESPFDRE
jgi:hypothetical protein